MLLGLTLAAYEVGLIAFGRAVVREARYVESVGNASAIAVHADIGNVVFREGVGPEVCVDVNFMANMIVVNPPHVSVSFAREGNALVVEVKGGAPGLT